MGKLGQNCRIAEDVIMDEDIIIGNNVVISKGVILYNNVEIGNNVVIGPYCIIGEPVMDYYHNKNHIFKKTIIGDNSIIRSHSVIYEDVNIGSDFQTGHRVTIREESLIGKSCSVGTMCDLQGKLSIGDFTRLHSNVHVSQYSVIENYVWIYPYVVTTNDPIPPMAKLKGSIIREFAQIATASIIMPGVEIGRNSLVGANSLVNKDVGEERVVYGNPAKDICSVRDVRDKEGNQIYPWKDYLTDFRGYPWQTK